MTPLGAIWLCPSCSYHIRGLENEDNAIDVVVIGLIHGEVGVFVNDDFHIRELGSVTTRKFAHIFLKIPSYFDYITL